MALDDTGRAIEPPLREGQKGEITLRLIFKGLLTLDFGHSPRGQIAGKWQPAEGFMAGAWDAA
ncbi:MAG TPA: hypothetical protein VE844_08460 [Gammaproteobacteria bacterium]|nr:hypothetical protein [Gammaproteobacteria bacterium]